MEDAVRPEARAPNPFLSIWTRPRETVRRLVEEDPARDVVILAIFGGVAQVVFEIIAAHPSESGPITLGQVVLFAGLIGPTVGLLTVYVGAALAAWSGRWIGGEATAHELRTAFGYANIPLVAALIPVVLLIAALGGLANGESDSGAYALLALIGFVVRVWAFVILLKGVGELQGFSAWKAWGNLILSMLPFILLGIVAGMLIALLAPRPA